MSDFFTVHPTYGQLGDAVDLVEEAHKRGIRIIAGQPIPGPYHARIGSRPATDFVDDAWINFDFIPQVANRGAAVIAARGRSSAASAANATIEHVRDWFNASGPDDWTSMAVPSDGSYGVPQGLVCSFPVTTANGDWAIVQGLRLSCLARSHLQRSIDALCAEAATVRQLGLVN